MSNGKDFVCQAIRILGTLSSPFGIAYAVEDAHPIAKELLVVQIALLIFAPQESFRLSYQLIVLLSHWAASFSMLIRSCVGIPSLLVGR
jgi:hypothetical protein